MLRYHLLFEEKMHDDIQKVLKVISKKGVSEILFCLERTPKRFSQIMFETRLNPGVLGRHLKDLINLNIIRKEDEAYVITDIGRNLITILQEFEKLISTLKENT